MSPDLLAVTEEIHLILSPDLLAATEAIDSMTPVKEKDQHHLHSFINPLSVRTHSLSARHATSPVRNHFLEDLRSEDVNHDAVVGDNGRGVNIRDECVENVLRDADGQNISCDVGCDDEIHWSESDCAEDANVDFIDNHAGSSEGTSASEGTITIIPGTAYDVRCR
jgi:hypothetical protein